MLLVVDEQPQHHSRGVYPRNQAVVKAPCGVEAKNKQMACSESTIANCCFELQSTKEILTKPIKIFALLAALKLEPIQSA